MTFVNVALRLRVAFITPTSLASFPPPRFGPRFVRWRSAVLWRSAGVRFGRSAGGIALDPLGF
jgi:hypothetical protein